MFTYCNNSPVNNADPSGQFVLAAACIAIVTGVVVGGIMGGLSSVAGGGDFWHGALEGAIIGGVSSSIAVVAPELGISALWSMLIGAGTGALIDFLFQCEETNAFMLSPFDFGRLLRAMGGGAVGAFYIRALAESKAIADAIYAAIISGELTELYGCIDIIANATQKPYNSQASQANTSTTACGGSGGQQFAVQMLY